MAKLSKTLPNKRTPDDPETETLIAVLTHPTRELQAQSLGITKQALINRMTKYKTKERIAEINADYVENATSRLYAMLPKTLTKLDKNLDSKDERIALDTSKEVLKRTIGEKDAGNTLIQNNIQIINKQKEKYDL